MRAGQLACAFAATASAAALNKLNGRSNYAQKDLHYVPRQWERVADAEPDHVIDLSIGLKQSNFDELERHLYEGNDHFRLIPQSTFLTI